MVTKKRIEEKIDQYVEKLLEKEELSESDFSMLQVCYTLCAMREAYAMQTPTIGCMT